MTASIRTVLASMVASETLIPEGEHGRWTVDGWGKEYPAAVLAPGTADELAGILARASEEGWRVLPAGLGSWLPGGYPPEADLVVSTRRINQIKEYEPADLTFTSGSGLSVEKLRESTSPHGQWLPLDPPGGLWVPGRHGNVGRGRPPSTSLRDPERSRAGPDPGGGRRSGSPVGGQGGEERGRVRCDSADRGELGIPRGRDLHFGPTVSHTGSRPNAGFSWGLVVRPPSCGEVHGPLLSSSGRGGAC